MDDSKKTVFRSSMVDLKAELFRKQEEFKQQKAAGTTYVKGATTSEKKAKGGIWSRQNAGVIARAKKDQEITLKDDNDEDDEAHVKSKKALEEKARLYDKLCNSSTIPDEDGSEYYLVDFQKKVIDSVVKDREAKWKKAEEEEDEAERRALVADIPEPENPDDEWIDFKDSLGRDRRCMKKDLDQLMKQDRDLALAHSRKKKEAGSDGRDVLPSVMSSDMHREMMKQKWENEMKELEEKGQKDIHYSNVRFDEVRSHGVGFFQFSKDHEIRAKQLEDLEKMREETVDEHSRKEHIKDRRKAMMEARLAKVRQRRNLKEPPAAVKSEKDQDSEEVGPKLSEASLAPSVEEVIKKEELEKQAEEKRKAHVREWDKEKQKGFPSRKNYIETLRDEREQEFAPPSAYFEEPKFKPPQASRGLQLQTFNKPNPTFHPSATSEISTVEHVAPENSSPWRGTLFCETNPTNDSQEQHFVNPGTNLTRSYLAHKDSPQYYDQSAKAEQFKQNQQQLRCAGFQPSGGNQNNEQFQYQQILPQQNTLRHLHQQHNNTCGSNSQQHNNTYCEGNQQPNYTYGGNSQEYNNTYGGNSQEYNNTYGGNSQEYNNTYGGNSQEHNNTYGSNSQQHNNTYGGNSQEHKNIYGGNSQEHNNTYGGNTQQHNYTYGGNTQQHITYVGGIQQPKYTYCSNSQQCNYTYGGGRQQLSEDVIRTTALPSSSGATLSNKSNSESVEPKSNFHIDSESIKRENYSSFDEPKKPKIPKMVIIDTRNVKNEEVPRVEENSSVNLALATAVPYAPGSFTAAKELTAQNYEESVAESRLRCQISGKPLLYTAEQIKMQQDLKIEQESEERQDATDQRVDEKIQEFLSSIRSGKDL